MARDEKDLKKEELGIIEGEFVNINQSSVRNVEGGHVEMQQVCALSIDGERIEGTQTASMLLRGNDIELNQCLNMATMSDNTTINYSFSPISFSRGETRLNRTAAGVIAADTVKADNSAAMIILANRVDGNVNTLFDWKSALAVGAITGGILGLLSIFRR
jgi:hypothetical protein